MNKVVLSLIAGSCVFMVGCKQKQPPPDPVVPVNLYTVQAKPVVYYDKYPSTTVALSQVNVVSQVQGYITGIFFKEGDHVTKGQKLYEIDTRLYRANYDSAVANLRVAEGNLLQAKQDEERYAYLNKYNAVAKQLYDHAVIALLNAQNQRQAAAQAVKNAQTNLSFSYLKAPFSGTIGISQVKLGNVVTDGSTVLNTISTDEPMAVDVLVNEKQLSTFEGIYKMRHNPVDSLFTMILPDNTLYPHTGKIYIIDRAVDPQSGTIRVRLVFPNPGFTLRVGMSCVIRVHNLDRTPQLVVPNKAVTEQMGEYFLYVARDTTVTEKDKSGEAKQHREMIAKQKKVQIGQVIGPDIIIKGGIQDGERIISDGIQALHDGTPITTANKMAPQQGGRGGRG
jgi:RND family efflux transporter MFP subunit